MGLFLGMNEVHHEQEKPNELALRNSTVGRPPTAPTPDSASVPHLKVCLCPCLRFVVAAFTDAFPDAEIASPARTLNREECLNMAGKQWANHPETSDPGAAAAAGTNIGRPKSAARTVAAKPSS